MKAKIAAQGISPQLKLGAEMGAHIQNEMARLRPVLDAIAAAANPWARLRRSSARYAR